ncbi:MAG: hypothetical protein AB7S44_04170 [Spirochaetales bacterium]
MKILVRLIIAALILAAAGLGVYYLFNMPNSAVETYNDINAIESETYYTDFDSQVTAIQTNYSDEAATTNYYELVGQALDNNFYYYKSLLLYIENATTAAQDALEAEMNSYAASIEVTYQLVTYFNNHYAQISDPNEVAGMYNNFLTAYVAQTNQYIAMVEALKNYVITYAFDEIIPQTLNYTLLQVQFEYAKFLDAPTGSSVLIEELTAILNAYSNFENTPADQTTLALSFVNAFNNLTDKEAYFSSLNKQEYIQNFLELEQQTYATIIRNYLIGFVA